MLNSFALAFVYLPGEDSTRATAHVVAAAKGPGRMRIAASRTRRAAPSSRDCSRICADFDAARLLAGAGLVKSTPFGFHGHLAGTLMRASAGPLETDASGRLSGTARVFVVDPAAFPTLPAQNLTFTAMANAMRVADGIAEQLS